MDSPRILASLRLLTILACACFFVSGDYPPNAQAQTEATDIAVMQHDIAQAKIDKDQINEHLRTNDADIITLNGHVNQNTTDIAVIKGNSDQDKWWIGLIALMTAGSFVWQVRQKKGA